MGVTEPLLLTAPAAVGAVSELETLALPLWTLYLSTAINALSGAAYAARRGFDFVGVIGLAISQGLGGLVLLAVLLQLGTSVVFTDPVFLMVSVLAGLMAFFFAAAITRALRFAIVLDALAMGLFVSLGVGQALQAAANPAAAVFLGVLTATGGLVLRDIMAGNAPSILRPGVLTGVVALAGSVLFLVLVRSLGMSYLEAQVSTVLFVGVVRSLAVWRDWRTHEARDFSARVSRYWEGLR